MLAAMSMILIFAFNAMLNNEKFSNIFHGCGALEWFQKLNLLRGSIQG